MMVQLKLPFSVVLLVLSVLGAYAQKRFVIRDASRTYNVEMTVAKCDDSFCGGRAVIRIVQKRPLRTVQTITLANTDFMPEEAEMSNSKGMYDAQSVAFFEDYDFDGVEDLALRDGMNGGYSGPSYRIYLFSRRTGRFEFNGSFTKLGQSPYLGMFQMDNRRKRLRAYSKTGCCMHFMEEYAVDRGRLVKVKEVSDYYNTRGDGMVDTETRTLINGKWRTRTRREKAKDQ